MVIGRCLIIENFHPYGLGVIKLPSTLRFPMVLAVFCISALGPRHAKPNASSRRKARTRWLSSPCPMADHMSYNEYQGLCAILRIDIGFLMVVVSLPPIQSSYGIHALC